MIVPPPSELLVEGHVVFAVVESVAGAPGPRVAQVPAQSGSPLDPAGSSHPTGSQGVRWFNDQDLVSFHPPKAAAVAVLVQESVGGQARLPCSGAVLLTPQGAPDPRAAAWSLSPSDYVESYRVVDVNDRGWTIDKWMLSSGPVWAVALLGSDATIGVNDDGASHCAVGGDAAWASPVGDNGLAYPGRSGPLAAPLPTESGLAYNALLLVNVADFPATGAPRSHAQGSAERTGDHTACDGAACPGGDEAREGNSHAFHGLPPEGSRRTASHGWSAGCAPGVVAEADCHATVPVELWFGTWSAPLARSFALYDVEGRTGRW